MFRRTILSTIVGLSIANESDSQSLKFLQNAPSEHEYGQQVQLPAGFGSGEFTFEMWIKPDDSFPTGSISDDTPEQLLYWSTTDNAPYSSSTWWFRGNFLLDGHNNSDFESGTFSLQFHGGGRVRWLFGDGADVTGGHWSVQAYPATQTPSLLDGQWHHLACVRRFVAPAGAQLELWVDGIQIATEFTPLRTDMYDSYWDGWSGFPAGQSGWFYGAEKQAAIGVISQYEDYKGLMDEMRFFDRAKSNDELQNDWAAPAAGNDATLIGWYRFNNGGGTTACNQQTGADCIQLFRTDAQNWSAEDAMSSVVPDPLHLYVDFNATEPGDGTEFSPFNTLAAAVSAAEPGALIELAASDSAESLVIAKPLRLIVYDPAQGTARIGVSAGGSASSRTSTVGFISAP